jgi:hypothetical protein
MKALLVVPVLAAAIFAGTAQAGSSQVERDVVGSGRPASGAFTERLNFRLQAKHSQALWGSTFLDGLVDGLSGWPLTTVLEDDPSEWYTLFGLDPSTVGGFVCITDADPANWCYHRVFLGPIPTTTFISWLNYNQSPTYWDAAVAIMVVTHEATHYRLFSADEGRVNACALQEFPGVITQYFQIAPTTTKTVPVKKTVWRWKWAWVHRHGKRVKVRKHVRHVVTRYEQRTFQNPDYVNLIAASIAFYRSQPPPYNTGTCY